MTQHLPSWDDGGHIQGPGCYCASIVRADGHVYRCPCGGFYHLVSGYAYVEYKCDVCGKDRNVFVTQELRI